MLGTAVTQLLPVPLIRANQIQATGDEDTAEEIVPEETVTKDVADETDASTTQHTHNQPEILWEKWRVLARF